MLEKINQITRKLLMVCVLVVSTFAIVGISAPKTVNAWAPGQSGWCTGYIRVLSDGNQYLAMPAWELDNSLTGISGMGSNLQWATPTTMWMSNGWIYIAAGHWGSLPTYYIYKNGDPRVIINRGNEYNSGSATNVIPSYIPVGGASSTWVQFRNTGSFSWTNDGSFRAGAVNDSIPAIVGAPGRITSPEGNWSSDDGMYYTGKDVRWWFNITGNSAGTGTLGYKMVRDGVTWFGETTSRSITVYSNHSMNSWTNNTASGQTESFSVVVPDAVANHVGANMYIRLKNSEGNYSENLQMARSGSTYTYTAGTGWVSWQYIFVSNGSLVYSPEQRVNCIVDYNPDANAYGANATEGSRVTSVTASQYNPYTGGTSTLTSSDFYWSNSAATETAYTFTNIQFLKGYTYNGYSLSSQANGGTNLNGFVTATLAANGLPTKITFKQVTPATLWFCINTKPKTYTLTFDKNGGAGGVSGVTTTYDTSYYRDISSSLPTRSGYTFAGYYTSASGGTQIYGSNGYNISDGTYWSGTGTSAKWKYDGNATLYAQWTPNTYTITLNANGGEVFDYTNTNTWKSVSLGYPTFDTYSWCGLGGYQPRRTNYELLGWYTAASGGTKIWDASGNNISDGTYWSGTGTSAQWKYPNNATFYAQWRDSCAPNIGPVTETLNGSGNRVLTFTVTDAAGSGLTNTVTLTSFATNNQSGTSLSKTYSAKTSISATEKYYEIEWTPSDNPNAGYGTQVNSIIVASDNDGNTTAKTNTPFYFDNILPTISVSITPTTWVNYSKTITASGADAGGSGFKGYYIGTTSTKPSVSDSGWINTTAGTYTWVKPLGTYYIFVKDGAGNISSAQAIVDKIDLISPTIGTATVSTAWGNTNKTITITGNADTGGSGIGGYYISTSSTAPTATTAGWVASTSGTYAFANKSAGTYYIWVKDSAGNVSSSYASAKVSNIETTAPTIASITVSNSNVWTNANKTITVVASDAGGSGISGYYVSTSSTAPTIATSGWAASTSGTWTTVKGNGIYYVWLKDAAGNISASKSITVEKIDTSAPTVNTVSVSTEWSSSGKSISVTSADTGGSGIAEYYISTSSTAPSSSTSGWALSTSTEWSVTKTSGTYYIWVKDAAGNVSASNKSIVVSNIDTTAPSAPTIAGYDGTWKNSNVIVSVAAQDSESGISKFKWSSNNGSLWTTVNASITGKNGSGSISFTAEYNNVQIIIRAVDAVGNESTNAVINTLKIDKTKPLAGITSISPSDYTDGNKVITVSGSDSASGVSGYYISTSSSVPAITATGWSATTVSTWQTTVTTNGNYYVFVKDAAGNVSNAATAVVSGIDKTAPVVSLSVADANIWTSSNKTLTATAVEEGSGIVGYYISTSAAVPTASSTWESSTSKSASWPRGIGTYYVWAKDGAGNISSTKSITVSNIDTAVPVLGSPTITPSGWTNTNKTISITASDTAPSSGIAGYYFSTTATAPTLSSTGWENTTANSKSWTEGNGTYYIWVKDAVGHISTSKTVVVSGIDMTAPTVSAAVTPSVWTNANKTITAIGADEGGSDVAGYYISTSATTPTLESIWENTSITTKTWSKGNGTYYIWSKDGAGNISSRITVVVDKIETNKPMISSLTAPTEWSASNKTITATVIENESGVSGYYISTSNTAPTLASTWIPSSQKTYSFTNKGEGTYYAWVRDVSGNISDMKSVIVTNIDKTAPVIGSIKVPSDWSNVDKEIMVSAQDVGSGIAGYYISTINKTPSDNASGWVENASETWITTKPTGIYYIWVKDKVGNISASKEAVVEGIDLTLPQITADVTPKEWTNTDKTITVIGTDVGSGIAGYFISSSEEKPTTETEGWNNTISGTMTYSKPKGTYYIWAKDASGNISSTLKVIVEKIDLTPPTIITATSPNAWSNKGKDITVTAQDLESGIGGYYLSKTNTKPSATDTAWVNEKADVCIFKNNEEGTYYVFVKDVLGNTSEGMEVIVKNIDKTSPDSISANNPKDNTWTNKPVTVTIMAHDVGNSGIGSFDVNLGSGWTQNGINIVSTGTYGSATYTFSQDMDKEISFRAKDLANNYSSEIKTHIKIDTVPPSGIIELSTDWTSADKKITVTAQDSASGIAGYNITTTSTEPSSGWIETSENMYSFIKDNGTYYVWVKDVAGNTVKLPVTVTNVDKKAPVISNVILSDEWGLTNTATIIATDPTPTSGIAGYAVTETTKAPTEWKKANSFIFSKNGIYYAWAIDNVGNVSSPLKFEVKRVDTEPPQDPVITKTPSKEWSNTDVVITVYPGVDSLSGIVSTQYRINNGDWVEYTSSITVSESCNLYARNIDLVGNESSAVIQVKIDKVRPTTPTFGKTPSREWSNEDVILTVIPGTDALSGVYKTYFSDDKQTWTEYSLPVTIKQTGIYYAKTVDKAGNETIGSINVKIDRDKPNSPVIIKDPNRDWTYKDTTINILSGTDALSGTKSTAYRVTNIKTGTTTKWVSFDVETQFTVMESCIIEAITYDNAGNSSLTTNMTVNIDKSSPTVPIIEGFIDSTQFPEKTWVNKDMTIKISGSVADTGIMGYEYRLNEGEWKTYSIPFKVSAKTVVEARSLNGAGKYSESSSFDAYVDKISPTIYVNNVPTLWQQQANLQAHPEDLGGSGVNTVTMTYPDGKTERIQSPYEKVVTLGGDYIFIVTDKAGNVTTKVIDGRHIDGEAPELSSVITYSKDFSVATITISSHDIGFSGVAYIMPVDSVSLGNEKITQAQVEFKITENGTYSFVAADKAGNISVPIAVNVVGILNNGDTSLIAHISSGTKETDYEITTNDAYIISLNKQTKQGSVYFSAQKTGSTITKVNGIDVNEQAYKTTYDVSSENEQFKITVKANNGLSEEYTVILSSGNQEPTIQIANEDAIKNTVYGIEGYVRGGVYTKYDATEKGIQLKVLLSDENVGQYIYGYASLSSNAAKYPILWDGTEKAMLTSSSATGYVNIPAADLMGISSAAITVQVSDYETATSEKISTVQQTATIYVDTTAPEISHSVNSETGVFTIITKDSNAITSVVYTVATDGNTPSAETPYDGKFTLALGHTHVVTITAIDILGNKSESSATVSFGEGAGQMANNDVISSETRYSEYYIINGGTGKPQEISDENLWVAAQNS